MTRSDENSLSADLAAIAGGLLADPSAVNTVSEHVEDWLSSNSDMVGEHTHAFMAAMAVRESLAAVDAGTSPAADPELVARYAAGPVSLTTVAALHDLCGYDVSETAAFVRRPEHEVAGLVADFHVATVAADTHASRVSVAPDYSSSGAATTDPGAATASGKRRFGRTRKVKEAKATQPDPVPRATKESGGQPAVRPGFLIALAVLVAAGAIYVATQILGGSDKSETPSESAAASRGDASQELRLAGVVPSPGCTAPDGNKAVEDATVAFLVNGNERSVRLVAPAATEGTTPGLIVDLGDVGKSVDDHLAATQIRSLPTPTPMAIATLAPADGLPQWNLAEVSDEPDDVGAVAKAVTTVSEQVCIDAGRIYVTGVGAGGQLAGLAACRQPGMFSGVAMITGFYVPEECPEGLGVNALVIFTNIDDVFPGDGGTGTSFDAFVGDPGLLRAGALPSLPSLADFVGRWTDSAGCSPVEEVSDATLATARYSGCADDTTFTLITASEVGHVWPQSAASDLAAFFD